jgi:hypothetical protein
MLSAMRSAITKMVFEGGRWIAKLVPGGAPMSAPDPLPSAIDDDGAPIRHAAGVLAQGRDLQATDLVGLTDLHVAWLRVLDRRQLCTVMARSSADIRAHVLGRTKIAGVPTADAATVAALVEARKPAPTAQGYRKLRDKLAEMEAGGLDQQPSAFTPAL